MRSTRARSAFTIVELIVALVVVATLLGLLFPALSSVRTGGRQTQCAGNLRQLITAAEVYAVTWREYPLARYYKEVDGRAHTVSWDWEKVTATREVVRPGPIWAYTDNPGEIMQCPGYFGPPDPQGDPYTGYNYNASGVGGEVMYVHYGWDHQWDRRGLRPGTARRPTKTAAFGCGGYRAGSNRYMRSPVDPAHPPDVRYSGGQAFHYADSTNVAWLDGHVAAVDRKHPGEAATEDLLDLLGYPDNAFLSNDGSAYDP